MIDAYRQAAAEVAEQVLREAYEPQTFNEMVKRSARATVAALGNFVSRLTHGKDATEELDLVKQCVQLLEDLNEHKKNDYFTFEEYVRTPQTKAMKQAQDAYAEQRKARLARQEQLVAEQLAREASAEFGPPLEVRENDPDIVTQEELTERSRKQFAEVSKEMTGKKK